MRSSLILYSIIVVVCGAVVWVLSLTMYPLSNTNISDDKLLRMLWTGLSSFSQNIAPMVPAVAIMGFALLISEFLLPKPAKASVTASWKAGDVHSVETLPEPMNEALVEPAEPEGILSDVVVRDG